jgi:IstB-like ATP binding protein
MGEANDDRSAVLRREVAVLIADTFSIPLAHVLRDACWVSEWQRPNDDLLVLLKDRYDWRAARALRYLGSLRQGLQDAASS